MRSCSKDRRRAVAERHVPCRVENGHKVLATLGKMRMHRSHPPAMVQVEITPYDLSRGGYVPIQVSVSEPGERQTSNEGATERQGDLREVQGHPATRGGLVICENRAQATPGLSGQDEGEKDSMWHGFPEWTFREKRLEIS